MAEWYSIAYTYHIFIHSPVNGHLGCFLVVAIVNSATTNVGVVDVSFWIRIFSGYMPRRGIAGSYSNSSFSFLRYLDYFSFISALHQWFSTRGSFVPSEDIGQCLRHFLIVITGDMLLAMWGESRDAANSLKCTGQRWRPQRTIQLKISMVPRLRNPALNNKVNVSTNNS